MTPQADNLELHGNYLFVRNPSSATSTIVKQIPGRVWVGTGYKLPCTVHVLRDLQRRLPGLLSDQLVGQIERQIADEQDRLERAQQARTGTAGEGNTMPVRAEPFEHQKRAHAMAMELFNA